MNIKNAEFIKGIRGTDPIATDGKDQFLFIGRSNVGKSSVINSLLNRKNLVRSSSTPGQTREINFFLVNGETYFVDFPGYGYAKTSMKDRDKLRKLILWYLERSGAKPRKAVLILDAQVGAKEFDVEMMGILREHGHNAVVVANKFDKLTQSEQYKQVKSIRETLITDEVVAFSATKGRGKIDLWNALLGE